jgi:hypothetical protein
LSSHEPPRDFGAPHALQLARAVRAIVFAMLLPLARRCLQRRRRALRTLEAQPLHSLPHVRLQHERLVALASEATGSHERERASLDDDGHGMHHVIVDARLHHPPLFGSKLYALHLKLQI